MILLRSLDSYTTISASSTGHRRELANLTLGENLKRVKPLLTSLARLRQLLRAGCARCLGARGSSRGDVWRGKRTHDVRVWKRHARQHLGSIHWAISPRNAGRYDGYSAYFGTWCSIRRRGSFTTRGISECKHAFDSEIRRSPGLPRDDTCRWFGWGGAGATGGYYAVGLS